MSSNSETQLSNSSRTAGKANISVGLLRGLRPLAELDQQCLEELVPLCYFDHWRPQQPLNFQGWQGQLVYLIKGEINLEFADGSTLVLVGGSEAASLPLGKSVGLPHSAKAITHVDLLRFDADRLDIMLTWNQLAAGGAGLAATEGADRTSVSVSDSPDWRCMTGLFAAKNLTQGALAGLPPAHIDQLLQRFQRIRAKRGEVVVRQGEPGDYYYLIEKGRCQVTRMVSGDVMIVADLKAGDAFGEEALVSDEVRNASVTMKTDGILLRLAKQDFVELLSKPLLQTYSHAEARRRVLAGAIWLDVRFPAEYLYDGLPGARNLPLNTIREACAALDPKPEYIVYCQSGRRSSAAAFLLAQRGFHVGLLEGGLCGSNGGQEREGGDVSKGARRRDENIGASA